MSYSNEEGVQRQIVFGPGPGEGSKGQISFNINYKVNFKEIFIPNFVCVITNERYKTYRTGFSFCCLGNAPGVELWGAGVPRWSKISNMVMWHISVGRCVIPWEFLGKSVKHTFSCRKMYPV